jgi:lysophospholipase L1-like esterase
MRRRLRLLLILFVGLLLCGAGWAYVELFLRRPVGIGPAGPAVPLQPFEQTWTDRRVLLLGIGDSMTAGLGASRPERSYFNRLVANPSSEFVGMRGRCLSAVLPNLEHENLAVSGTTSIYHAQLIRDDLPTYDPDVFGLVVMTTGGNDLIHNYGRTSPREGAMYGATLEQAQPWIENFERRLAEMLDLLGEPFPGGCEIFVGNIYDPTDGVGDAPSVYLPHWPDGLAIHTAYNEVIQRAACGRPNVHVVPIYEAFLGHGSHCRQFWRPTYDASDPHYWYFSNIEDPNDRGYDALRRLFLNRIVANSALVPTEAETPESGVPTR